jgi:hypothetical protein
MDVIKMELPDACARLWQEGRDLYGPHRVGHPLKHLAEKIADGINWAEEAERWGYRTGLIRLLLKICWGICKRSFEG